jgi:hypothetical protein
MDKPLLREILNVDTANALPYKKSESFGTKIPMMNNYISYDFKLGDLSIEVVFSNDDYISAKLIKSWSIMFLVDGELDKDKSIEQSQMFILWTTIGVILLDFIKEYNPERIEFSGHTTKLDKFYSRLGNKLQTATGYSFISNDTGFELTRVNNG